MTVLRAVATALKPGGRVLILGPNFRCCPRDYYDYFDHHLPLTEKSVAEATRARGLRRRAGAAAHVAVHVPQPASKLAVAGVALSAAALAVAVLRRTVLRRRKKGYMTPIIGSSDLSPRPRSFLGRLLRGSAFRGGRLGYHDAVRTVLVVKFGCNFPRGDEWAYVSYMTGEQPVTAELLWAQHNEHRIPLPKAIHLVLSRLTNCDYRAGMVLNVITLAALAFAMIRVARRLRGSLSYADAFFPLALLQLGQM